MNMYAARAKIESNLLEIHWLWLLGLVKIMSTSYREYFTTLCHFVQFIGLFCRLGYVTVLCIIFGHFGMGLSCFMIIRDDDRAFLIIIFSLAYQLHLVYEERVD